MTSPQAHTSSAIVLSLPAPLQLVYVVDGAAGAEPGWEECGTFSALDVAHITRSVAAYCARAGLVATAECRPDPQLATALALDKDQRIAMAQGIAYESPDMH